MLDPKDLESRAKRAVAGAGYSWAGMTPAEQAKLIEVANELLRPVLRERDNALVELAVGSGLARIIANKSPDPIAADAAKKWLGVP